MGHAGVAYHHPPGGGDHGRQPHEVGSGVHDTGVEPGPVRHRTCQVDLAGPGRDDHAPAGRGLRAGQRGPAIGRPPPRLVGGAFGHADVKVPRFNVVDFRLKSAMDELLAATPGLAVPGFGVSAATANFADWPFDYAALEPFYSEVEQLYGVQGDDGNPFASHRSKPYPMPPGVPMSSPL